MFFNRQLTLLLLVVITPLIYSQQKQNLKLESVVAMSNHDILPLWLHANEWGKYNGLGDAEVMLYLKGDYQLFAKKNFSMQVGLGGVVKSDLDNSFFHESFVSGHLWFVDYSVGKEARSWLAYNDRLSSGHFLISSNVRPIPKITLGIYDYKPLRFTNNWLEIKGGITQGVLNDDRGGRPTSTSDLLLHEKWAYGRLGNTRVKPYAGIVHSVLFGGTRPDGTKIPVDFWPTFFAEGSAKLGGGEETNAAGAHMGLWDFGFYCANDQFDLQFYWQKPFADGSGMRIWNGRNKDRIIGVLMYPKEINWLKGVSLEIIKTDVQSDYGIPDQLYPVEYKGHKKGSIIWRDDIESDLDGFMSEVFGETSTGWLWEDVMDYMEVAMNEGFKFGGRDDYMNNGTYYSGWTYHGASMGTPLYHTIEQAQSYHDGLFNNHQRFINNRVNAIHLGVEGNISDKLAYRFKSTYSVNYGSYAEEFAYRYSWEPTGDYFYKGGLKQCYTMMEAVWKPELPLGLEINGAVAYDFGELYHSFGGRIGVVYRPRF